MGKYIRLIKGNAGEKEGDFFNESKEEYVSQTSDFRLIAGYPFAYWLGPHTKEIFKLGSIGSKVDLRMGLTTGRNDHYLRYWFEPNFCNVGIGYDRASARNSGLKWFPYDKGGEYRKWYGNRDYVVNWLNDGYEMQNTLHPSGNRIWAHNFNLEYNFRKHISWNDIVTKHISFRAFEDGFLFDSSAATAFIGDADYYKILGYLNCSIVDYLASVLNPTLHFKLGDFEKLPFIDDVEDEIEVIVKDCISICKSEWDSFEYSWDFKKHVCIGDGNMLIEEKFKQWSEECEERFQRLKSNEEKINKYFSEIYGLEDEIDTTVDNDNVAIRRADLEREIKSLISYAVGCIMGRYSLKEEGLVYAGGEWDDSKYAPDFMPCDYGVMPITEEQFFEEDLCTRVIDFIKVVYGEAHLNENLRFIASALKPDSYDAPKKIIREYLFNDFFDNHYQIYQHRPIYWQLDSGKTGGFRAIMYMHRFNENILPLIRTEFIQDLRYKYEDEMQRQKARLEGATSTAEKNVVKKVIDNLDKKIVECSAYDELLNHASSSIQNYIFDLDDGVKTNYAKFLSIDGDKTKNILTVIKL